VLRTIVFISLALLASNIHGRPEWDQADGFSFWVRGEGTEGFGGLEFIDDDEAGELRADPILSGGDILTINERVPTAGALAVRDGRIVAVGSSADVLKLKGSETRLVDLGGKTLLPGFILKNRGKDQTDFVSPMKTALGKGLHPTNHTDLSVLPIDQMLVVWSAVNRIARTGEVIGPDERVTPMEALKAITIDAAYQYSEEDRKGSLEVGKLADLVILDQNPLKVEPTKIKDIRIVETIKEGKTVYRRSESP